MAAQMHAGYIIPEPMIRVRGRMFSTVFCHLSRAHALVSYAQQPPAKLQLISRSRMACFPLAVTNRKGFCRRFCHSAELLPLAILVLPRTLPMMEMGRSSAHNPMPLGVHAGVCRATGHRREHSSYKVLRRVQDASPARKAGQQG